MAGLLAEDGLFLGRLALAASVSASSEPRPLAQDERPGERLLDRDLLIEREADQQGHRVGGDQRVGLVGLGEVERARARARVVVPALPHDESQRLRRHSSDPVSDAYAHAERAGPARSGR